MKENVNSSHIMVYIGSYITNSSNKENNEYITYEKDPNTSYKSYMDLETSERYNIAKDDCLEFEEKYLTLYLSISEYAEDEYLKKYLELQEWFKIQLICRPKSDVIQEIREKYERKHKAIYPYFYRIDTIADLPIAEYVETYPADGFIEKYCLSKDEYRRVKLYRKQNVKK